MVGTVCCAKLPVCEMDPVSSVCCGSLLLIWGVPFPRMGVLDCWLGWGDAAMLACKLGPPGSTTGGRACKAGDRRLSKVLVNLGCAVHFTGASFCVCLQAAATASCKELPPFLR